LAGFAFLIEVFSVFFTLTIKPPLSFQIALSDKMH